MFPFASHAEYDYKLAPLTSEALAEAGTVAAQLGHRVNTHPGQFTQLGSPRAEVITNALRDLEYHDEMLSPLKLTPQEDRDAVMVLHMGGTFGRQGSNTRPFPDELPKSLTIYQITSHPQKRRCFLVSPRSPPCLRRTQHPILPCLPLSQHHYQPLPNP